jgi:DNA-directed RNA polymerase specialized sigma24 family protein
LKIISLHTHQTSLIHKAIKNDREAQQHLFEQYAPKMLGVCRQYVKDIHHAEDLLLQGFLRFLTTCILLRTKEVLKVGFVKLW